MAPEKAPAFQFYAEKFLLDERQAVMTLAQSGAYVRLMSYCWRELTIPDDPDLCRVLVNDGRVTARQFREMWPLIRSCFEPTEDGRLRHATLDREREKQAQWRQKSANGGRHSQANRKGGSTTLEAEPVEPPLEPKANIPSPSPSLVPPNPPSGGIPPPAGGSLAPLGLKPRVDVAWPGRPPVPGALHAEFRSKLGGDEDEADAELRAWYPEVAAVWEGRAIGDDDWRFWRLRFREWVGTTARETTSARPSNAIGPPGRSWYEDCHHDPKCETLPQHQLRLHREQAA